METNPQATEVHQNVPGELALMITALTHSAFPLVKDEAWGYWRTCGRPIRL